MSLQQKGLIIITVNDVWDVMHTITTIGFDNCHGVWDLMHTITINLDNCHGK